VVDDPLNAEVAENERRDRGTKESGPDRVKRLRVLFVFLRVLRV